MKDFIEFTNSVMLDEETDSFSCESVSDYYTDYTDIFLEMYKAHMMELELYQEAGVLKGILDDATGKGKDEAMIIKILKFIPRLLMALARAIGDWRRSKKAKKIDDKLQDIADGNIPTVEAENLGTEPLSFEDDDVESDNSVGDITDDIGTPEAVERKKYNLNRDKHKYRIPKIRNQKDPNRSYAYDGHDIPNDARDYIKKNGVSAFKGKHSTAPDGTWTTRRQVPGQKLTEMTIKVNSDWFYSIREAMNIFSNCIDSEVDILHSDLYQMIFNNSRVDDIIEEYDQQIDDLESISVPKNGMFDNPDKGTKVTYIGKKLIRYRKILLDKANDVVKSQKALEKWINTGFKDQYEQAYADAAADNKNADRVRSLGRAPENPGNFMRPSELEKFVKTYVFKLIDHLINVGAALTNQVEKASTQFIDYFNKTYVAPANAAVAKRQAKEAKRQLAMNGQTLPKGDKPINMGTSKSSEQREKLIADLEAKYGKPKSDEELLSDLEAKYGKLKSQPSESSNEPQKPKQSQPSGKSKKKQKSDKEPGRITKFVKKFNKRNSAIDDAML
jgi:hypothetical protein